MFFTASKIIWALIQPLNAICLLMVGGVVIWRRFMQAAFILLFALGVFPTGPLILTWLEQHYPDRAARVLARVQDLHGVDDEQRGQGRSYDSNFVSRMKGSGIWAQLLSQRFHKTCDKLGLNRERTELDLTLYRASLAKGQQVLF